MSHFKAIIAAGIFSSFVTSLSAQEQISETPALLDSIITDSMIVAPPLPTLDTLYYGRGGKATNHVAFASYYRVMPNHNDPDFEKIFRDFYPTGELKAEGGYLSMDTKDDSKTVFDGECIFYYKSGHVQMGATYENGVLHGVKEEFKEDGHLKLHAEYKHGVLNGVYQDTYDGGIIKNVANYKDGKKTGLCFEYDETGKQRKVYEYIDGEYANDYYMFENENGCLSKMSIATDSIIWEAPLDEDRIKYYSEGDLWYYYNKNGLQISMQVSVSKEYGKYYAIDMMIDNKSMAPFEFDPSQIVVIAKTQDGNKRIKTLDADQFIRKTRRQLNRQAMWAATSEYFAGVAQSNIGTAWAVSGAGVSQAMANAGWGNTGTSVYGTKNASFDVATAAQTHAANGANSRQLERDMRKEAGQTLQQLDSDYVKRNTINQGDSYAGYCVVERKKCEALLVMIKIHGVTYMYPFSMTDITNRDL